MSKVLKDASLTTKSAREGLPEGLHWATLDQGRAHLGYRKLRRGAKGGAWIVRWRAGKGYLRANVGPADDVLADGLSYAQARTEARRIVDAALAKAKAEAAATAAGVALTVADAVRDYVAERNKRQTERAGRPVRSDADQRLSRYVLGQPARGREPEIAPADIAALPLFELKADDLRRWQKLLPASMKGTTIRRLRNDLKAALNHAHEAGASGLPADFPLRIKSGLNNKIGEGGGSVARDDQVLSDADVGRLLSATKAVDQSLGHDGDLFRLIVVLAATGARFSQVVRLRVKDCQLDQGRILVPSSRKGRVDRIADKRESISVPVGADIIEALRPVVQGRRGSLPLLERWRSVQLPGGIAWARDRRGPWQSPAEIARPWRAIRETAGLPDAIPYSLRHTSIVRAIRAGLPISLVASNHDTSTVIVENHYARWISSSLYQRLRRLTREDSPDSRTVILSSKREIRSWARLSTSAPISPPGSFAAWLARPRIQRRAEGCCRSPRFSTA